MLILFSGKTASAQYDYSDFANGTDTAFVSNTEYFINADDEDKLYAYMGNKAELILDEHIITLIEHNTLIYLVIYRNDSSLLAVYDTTKATFDTLLEFDGIINSIARSENIIYYASNGNIEFYDTDSKTSGTFKADSNIQFIYFSDAVTLKFFDGTSIKAINLDGKTNLLFDTEEKENASGETSTYKPRLTAPDRHDPYYTTLNPLHRGGYGMVDNGGNCTCYAYGRSYENLGYDPQLCTRAAGKWYAYNKAEGRYAYGDEPALGAVAVWTKSGGDGHVAVVEIIDGDTIVTSESGWQTFYFKTVTRSLLDSDLSASSAYSFQGYIYVMGFSTSENGENTIKFDSLTLPVTITQGSPFSLKGSIISTSSRLTGISAAITDLDGNTIISKEIEVDTFVYELNGSEIDSSITFGILTPGIYILHYNAVTENGITESVMQGFVVEPAPLPLVGDINADGEINSRDIARLQKYLADLNTESEIQAAYDVDSNGKLDSRDISKLQKLIWEAE